MLNSTTATTDSPEAWFIHIKSQTTKGQQYIKADIFLRNHVYQTLSKQHFNVWGMP